MITLEQYEQIKEYNPVELVHWLSMNNYTLADLQVIIRNEQERQEQIAKETNNTQQQISDALHTVTSLIKDCIEERKQIFTVVDDKMKLYSIFAEQVELTCQGVSCTIMAKGVYEEESPSFISLYWYVEKEFNDDPPFYLYCAFDIKDAGSSTTKSIIQGLFDDFQAVCESLARIRDVITARASAFENLNFTDWHSVTSLDVLPRYTASGLGYDS